MGFGALLEEAIKTTGDAKRESGEDITWADVDYDKLRSSRLSHPGVTSWDRSMSGRDDNTNIKVNDSKGGVGGLLYPSTEEVRQSLRAEEVRQSLRAIEAPQANYYIDPYVGFSEASMGSQPPPPLASSQASTSPISGIGRTSGENTTQYMGRPMQDDDDNQAKVGQIS